MPIESLTAFPDEPIATTPPAKTAPPTAAPPSSALSAFPHEQTDPLGTVMSEAGKTPAPAAAEIFDLQLKTGLPHEVIARNLDDVRRQASAADFDPVAFRQSSPLLTKWLTAHPLNASAAQDDLLPLTKVEHAITLATNSVRALGGGLIGGLNVGAWGVLQAAGDVFGLPGVTAWAKAAGEDAVAMQTGLRGEQRGAGPNEKAFYSGFESMGSSAPILLAGLAGLPEAAVLTLMGTQTGGQAYTQARAAGVSIPGSLAFGTSQGAVEAATEMLPVHALFGDLAQKAGLFRTLAHQAILEVPGEQLATALQDLNEWAVLRPGEPFSTYLQERPSAAVQTLIATLVATGAQTGAVHTLNRAIGGLTAERTITDLGAAVTDSQLASASPAKFREFVEGATKDTPLEHVYASVDTWTSFWQAKGIDPAAMAEQAGSSKAAYADAVETGADLRLPTAGYATAVGGTEHNAFWAQELRLVPGEMNSRESQEFIAAHSDAVTAAAVTPATPSTIQAIHTQLVKHLVERGQMRAEDAETNAAVVSAMLEHYIERRAGLDAQTIFEARTDPRFVERVIGPDDIGTGPSTGTAGPGDEPLYQDDLDSLLQDPAALAALERRQSPTATPPETGDRRAANEAALDELQQETRGANAVGAGGGQQTLRALRNDPTLKARARALQLKAQGTPRVRAEFLAHGPDGPLFNIVGGPKHGSTVGLKSLEALGLPVPEIPADTGEKLNGDQLRAKMIAAKATPAPKETLFQPLAQGQQVVPGPMFFSRVVAAVEASKLAKAPGSQWVATIKNYKGGTAKGEVELRQVDALAPAADTRQMGLPELGLDGDKVYTKQEVLDFLTQTVLEPEIVELEGESVDEDDLQRMIDARREERIDDEANNLRENHDEEEEREYQRERFYSHDAPATEVEHHEADPDDEESEEYWTASVDGEVMLDYSISIGRLPRGAERPPLKFDSEQEAQDAIDDRLSELADEYVDENYSEPNFYEQAREMVDDDFDEDAERQDIIDQGHATTEGTRYGEYVLDGPRDNYREVFVTFPDTPGVGRRQDPKLLLDPRADVTLGDIVNAAGDGPTGYAILLNGEPWRDAQGNALTVWNPSDQAQALADAKEQYQRAVAYRQALAKDGAPTKVIGWRDGHSPYKDIINPVARLRVNERETAMGTVLFVEEVQPPHDNEQAKIPSLLIRNWRELGFKWALRDAAERGLAGVAWTTGVQQADRYSLQRHVQKIVWEANESGATGGQPGGRTVTIVPKDYGVISLSVNADNVVTMSTDTRFKDKKLAEVIGDELVARMTERAGTLEEEGLAIGGEGLKRLYDKDFVNVVNGLAAVKQAKGRVEQVAVQTTDDTANKRTALYRPARGIEPITEGEIPGWSLILEDGSRWASYTTEADAQQALEEWNKTNATDSRFTTHHVIRMTPELTAAVLAGQPLFQGEAEKRGATSFNAQGQALISLFAQADLTTFPHETAHLFLELIGDTVDVLKAMDPTTLTESQRAVVMEYDQVLLPFLGVSNRASISRDQHEKFAAAWEDYLQQGEAPSAALRSVFGRMKAWLVGVYRNVARQLTLTPEVRQFMDRLLASDDAIKAAERDARIVPIFTDAAAAGMTPEVFALYRRTIEQASLAAHERLDTQIAAEVAKQQQRTYKAQKAQIQETVQAELEQLPVYRALDAMRTGTNPDGTPIEGQTEGMKLNRDQVVALIGEAATKALPRPAIYTRDGGLSPQQLAELYGFSSGQAMLEAIGRTPPLKAAVSEETERRMLAAHGGLLVDGTLLDKAKAAVANEDRDRIIRAEMKALQALQRTVKPHVRLAEAAKNTQIAALAGQVSSMQATARRGPGIIARAIPSADTLRATAKQRIADSPVRLIQPQLYWAAARKANDLAVAAAARQDFGEAIAAQTQQLLNLALYREATKVLENVEHRVAFARSLDKPASRRRLSRAGASYQDQIDGILDRYEFAPQSQKTLDRRASLRKWAAAMEGDGFEVALDDAQLDDARQVNYRELTYAELVGVTDSLKQIEHLAHLKFRLLEQHTRQQFVDVRDGLVDSIRGHNTVTPLPLEFTPADDRRRGWAFAFASHRKIAMLARALDGHTDGGALWEAVIRRLNAAADQKLDRSKKEVGAFSAILEAHYPGRQLAALHQLTEIPAIHGSLTHEGRLAVALNWGTQEGRDRLLADPTRRWSQAQVEAILDTLDARDWAFVRATWAYNEKFWPEIRDQQERVTGIAPDKVVGLPMQTKTAGNFPGGYYHLAYDGRLSPRAQQNEAATLAELGKAAAYVRATTRQGHVETRQQGVRLSVRLDLGVQFAHIEEVIHSLTHRETLIDVNRLLRDSQVQKAIYETAGDQVYRQFTTMIEDIAIGTRPADNLLDKSARFMKTGTQIAGLAWNLWTAAQQPLGLFNGMQRVGVGWVMRGMGRWLRDASTFQATTTWIAEVSPMMRHRIDTATQDLTDLRQQLRRAGWFDQLVRTVSGDHLTQQAILDGYLWHIGLMQRVADVPTWLGQYEKSMAAGEPEARAVALADQAVLDSQGGGQTKDLASVQRGKPLAQLYMTFYSYGSTVLNAGINAVEATSFKSPASVATLLGHLSLLYVLPALGTVAMAHGFGKAGGDDDDWRTWLTEVARETASSALNGIVGLRELGGLLAEGTRGYEGPAGARLVSLLYKLGGQAKQGTLDEGLLKAANAVAGVVFRYPAAQVQRTVDGFAALEEGRSQNPMVLLTGPPPKKASGQ